MKSNKNLLYQMVETEYCIYLWETHLTIHDWESEWIWEIDIVNNMIAHDCYPASRRDGEIRSRRWDDNHNSAYCTHCEAKIPEWAILYARLMGYKGKL